MSEEKIDEQENFSEEEYSGEEEEFHTFEEEKTGDSNLSAAEKKRKYKELKESRKKHKPNYEEISKAKKLWEIARNTKVDEKERDEAMSELVSTIKGKLGDISLKRDASRIIQTCLKQGTPEQRLLIASELKGSYVSLSMNMYSKFIVTKVLNYCPSMRNDIINEFRGQIVKLIKHKDASSVIDEIFQVYANASQKLTLIEEFFGSQFIILKKIDKSLTVEKLFENEPNKRDVIMKHMGTTLQSIVNKGSLQFALVHRVLHDFLLYATPSEAKDLIEMLKEIVLAELVHTKEGMFVALCVLAQSEAKQRKSIVKGLKQHLEKILLDEFGAIFVVGVLYLMDDTVLVSKAILLDYFHKLDDFIVNENARKIILYLLCGSSPKCFSPFVIQTLEKVSKFSKSKKDLKQKEKELLDFSKPYLVDYFKKKGESLLTKDSISSFIAQNILLVSHDDESVSSSLKSWLESELSADHILVNLYSSKALRKCYSVCGKIIFDFISQHSEKVFESGAVFHILSLLNDQILGLEAKKAFYSNKKQFKALSSKTKDLKLKAVQENILNLLKKK